jgi:hypothetical protein
MLRATLGAGFGVAVLVAAAPAADAATICVQDPGCVGEVQPTLAAAVTAAGDPGTHPGRDRIQIGAGANIEGATVADGNQVDIVGAGPGLTTVRRGTLPDPWALRIGDGASTVSDLAIEVPDTNDDTGLVLAGTARNVTVTKVGTGQFTLGVLLLRPNATFSGKVVMPTKDCVGITMNGGPGVVGGIVEDAEVTAGDGITAVRTIRRVRVTATRGISDDLGGHVMTVDDALVRLATTGFGVGLNVSFKDGELLARNVTLIGNADPGSVGIRVAANSMSGPNTMSAVISDAIVSGFATDIRRTSFSPAGDAARATLSITHSDFDPAKVVSLNQGAAATGEVTQGAGNVNLEPQFRNPADGDFGLLFSSPLIDAGDPAPLAAGRPDTAVDGAPRVVDGNGDGSAIPDMGAFEYQRRAPVVSAGVVPDRIAAGRPALFVANGSDPEGESLGEPRWAFDDGATATGAQVGHAFATAATHTATVSIQDASGAVGTATIAVLVVPAPPPAPFIKSFSATNRTFAAAAPRAAQRKKKLPVGTKFRYDVTLASAVTIRLDRALPGKVSGSKCVAPTKRNRRARACTRYVLAGKLTQKAKAGKNELAWNGLLARRPVPAARYRATISAVAGRASNTRTLTLEVAKKRR